MSIPMLAGAPITDWDAPPAVHAWNGTLQTDLSNTAAAPGSPQVDVTFTAPSSGRVMVVVGGGVRDNGGSNRVLLTFELREEDVSGTVIQPASAVLGGISNTGAQHPNYQYLSRVSVAPVDTSGMLPPLVPGRQYFARVMQSVSGGSTADIFWRDLTVVPLPLNTHYHPGYGQRYTRAADRTPVAMARDTITQSNIDAPAGDPDPGDPPVEIEFVAPRSGRMLLVCGGGARGHGGANRVRVAPIVRVGSATGPVLAHHSGDNVFTVWGWSNAEVNTTRWQYVNRLGFLGEPATDPLVPGQRYHAQVFMQAGGAATADVYARELYAIPLS